MEWVPCPRLNLESHHAEMASHQKDHRREGSPTSVDFKLAFTFGYIKSFVWWNLLTITIFYSLFNIFFVFFLRETISLHAKL